MVIKLHITQHRNVHTSDDAKGEVDVEKSRSERRQRKTDTHQKTSSHCYRATTKLITQLTSHGTYNSTALTRAL